MGIVDVIDFTIAIPIIIPVIDVVNIITIKIIGCMAGFIITKDVAIVIMAGSSSLCFTEKEAFPCFLVAVVLIIVVVIIDLAFQDEMG